MFETAELGQKISKEDFRSREPSLREELLEAQTRLREAGIPVVVLFSGVDGAGKGETANLLNEWMDPHFLVTRAYGEPSEEEAERPEYWRFWRDLPAKGNIGIFLSAWYSNPLVSRAYGETTVEQFDQQLDRINAFEKTLVDGGVLVVKFWMHLGKDAQEKRFKRLEKDELNDWRVTAKDWEHWRMYSQFHAASEHIIKRTSTAEAPWTIVEGMDHRYRSVKVCEVLLDEIDRCLPENGEITATNRNEETAILFPVTVLGTLDMSKKLSRSRYKARLGELQSRRNKLHREARERKISSIVVFEGWDAAGKGGAIRRMVAALDARDYQVISISAPNDEERAHHYLWRFWRHLSRAGRVTVFDRSWYGRVLVERVEGFATEEEWRRAYSEINDFEQQLVDHGTVVTKFWVHITRDEQESRFEARAEVPYKRWKLTAEDWRNRESWDRYEIAVNDMVGRTSTLTAPWHLVEGNDKRYSRIKVLETVCDDIEKRLGRDNGKAAQG